MAYVSCFFRIYIAKLCMAIFEARIVELCLEMLVVAGFC